MILVLWALNRMPNGGRHLVKSKVSGKQLREVVVDTGTNSSADNLC